MLKKVNEKQNIKLDASEIPHVRIADANFCDVANNNNADIFISIHMDSFASSTPSGTTGYYYGKGTKAAMRLAQNVSDEVVATLSTGHRGVKSCNFYVVKHTAMPAILLEVNVQDHFFPHEE